VRNIKFPTSCDENRFKWGKGGGGPRKRMPSLNKPSPTVTTHFKIKTWLPSAYKMHTKLKDF
jgi:hypothetical protein